MRKEGPHGMSGEERRGERGGERGGIGGESARARQKEPQKRRE